MIVPRLEGMIGRRHHTATCLRGKLAPASATRLQGELTNAWAEAARLRGELGTAQQRVQYAVQDLRDATNTGKRLEKQLQGHIGDTQQAELNARGSATRTPSTQVVARPGAPVSAACRRRAAARPPFHPVGPRHAQRRLPLGPRDRRLRGAAAHLGLVQGAAVTQLMRLLSPLWRSSRTLHRWNTVLMEDRVTTFTGDEVYFNTDIVLPVLGSRLTVEIESEGTILSSPTIASLHTWLRNTFSTAQMSGRCSATAQASVIK